MYHFQSKKKKITLNYLNLQLWDFSEGLKSRGKHGKQAISVRATEALLYSEKSKNHFSMFFFVKTWPDRDRPHEPNVFFGAQ